jgi:predicted RNase H-like nuclease (RuvC/YqgF family)
VIDAEDNCVNEYNPDQADSDRDHIGDACDIDQLQQQIDDMSLQVEYLTDQNETLENQMENLISVFRLMNQRMENLEAEISTLSDDNAIQQKQITKLKRRVANHSHSYLTGSGKGHNAKKVSTGPAIFPAGPEPEPKGK